MKIEIRTKDNSEYVKDTVTFEENGDFIKIDYDDSCFSVRKTELKKVLYMLSED